MEKIAKWPEYKPPATGRPFTDLVVVSQDGTEIDCHRYILASQSKVFHAMLEADMKEAKENRIKLNVSKDVLKNFIRFLYTNNIKDKSMLQNCEVFLDLAEQYDLGLLKLKIEAVMIKNLTTDTMLDYFLLGEHFKAENIKESSKIFIESNKEYLREEKNLTTKLKFADSSTIVELLKTIL